MTIQYCSDLHLEFPENKRFLEGNPLVPTGEILLLAGDILPIALHKKQTDFIDFVADHFEAVYWVPGNHEYYQYDLGKQDNPLLEKLRNNVWLVNNQCITYKNVNLICSTLWSNINPLNSWDLDRSISDFYAIRWNGKKFTTQEFNQLHLTAKTFVANALTEHKEQTNIVVTHHVPTLCNYPRQYLNSPLNEAFAVELHDFIYDSSAAYWIYGHHHNNTPAFTIGYTSMLTNQLGYVQQNEQAGFLNNACITLSQDK